MKKVTVIDYGAGNLLSITRALEHCGAQAQLTDSAEDVKAAELLILPGVGAFEDGMKGLRESGLIEAIKFYAASGRPLLGICLGMQMLLEESDEFGRHEGLGLIPGRVEAIPQTDAKGQPHKIPHIGWNTLKPVESDWEKSILKGIKPMSSVYFVHSFTAVPKFSRHRLADTYYNGRLISASVCSGNIYGTQFHPEKSGETGLAILRNFIALVQAPV